MTSLLSISPGMPGTTLESYIAAVGKIPILSLEEERSLATRFRQDGDLDAARALVLSHLRFVVRVARGYAGYGLQQSDLVQEGNIGLMKAVKRFDPSVGVRLVSFAVHWIRAEIHEFILRNWRIVRVATTKAQRKLFFNLRNSRTRVGWMNHEEVAGVAEDLGVTAKDVLEMESRLTSRDESFDLPDADEERWSAAPANYIEDRRFNPESLTEVDEEALQGHEELEAALETLDDRSRDIVERRWLREGKATLQELAQQYGVSAERIRQLEVQAMRRLRASIATARLQLMPQ